MGVTAPVSRRPAQPNEPAESAIGSCAACARAAGIVVAITLIDLAYQLIHNASPAINRFGIGFLVPRGVGPELQDLRRRRHDLRHCA